MTELVELLKNPPKGEEKFLVDLLTNRVPAGVDEAAYVKAAFLSAVAKGEATSPLVSKEYATELLGTMQGGYNIATLIDLLDDSAVAPIAAASLSKTLLMFDAFFDVERKARAGNAHAKKVMQSWADGEWFINRPTVPEKITVTVFKVPGETNTDDLSPAPDAWSEVGPLDTYKELEKKGFPLAYLGDVVGTGSSRKSATNSILWFFGEDIPNVPNKRAGGVCIGNKIAPIFYNTMEDSGALPLEMPVDDLNMGDVIDIYPYEGVVKRHDTQEEVCRFSLKTEVLLDEVRAGGRIPLIIGKGLTNKARHSLGLPHSDIFRSTVGEEQTAKGYTLAQKMVGRACGLPEGKGVLPGTYCEPTMTTVGECRDKALICAPLTLSDLACLGFSADLVLQSFCHTAAYPKPVDVVTHHSLPDFIRNRGDGIIHSWLNRMLLPDTVGTGGDSHTRFPMGISFPAGSGLVAFAAATGVMPLDMPESVLVRFSGKMQPGITLRDLVHAIPYFAIQEGMLTVEKKNKKNIFSGRILEIEGLPNLTCEQAFELSDASAERSAAGCTIKLAPEPVLEYLNSNVTLLKWMIAEGYGDERTIARRIAKMEGEFRVFPRINSTNIGRISFHEGDVLVLAASQMDASQLVEEGYYSTFGKVGARTEMPGCSLCMGNQARVADKSSVVSTSTRNFPNRLGKGANVFLASAELAAVAAIEGELPTPDKYMTYSNAIDATAKDTYRYLNFDRIEEFVKRGADVDLGGDYQSYYDKELERLKKL
ncbi:acnB [Symbiodinium microadriaticum]|nr:acnB [Symbiodinium microadriaticum]